MLGFICQHHGLHIGCLLYVYQRLNPRIHLLFGDFVHVSACAPRTTLEPVPTPELTAPFHVTGCLKDVSFMDLQPSIMTATAQKEAQGDFKDGVRLGGGGPEACEVVPVQ